MDGANEICSVLSCALAAHLTLLGRPKRQIHFASNCCCKYPGKVWWTGVEWYNSMFFPSTQHSPQINTNPSPQHIPSPPNNRQPLLWKHEWTISISVGLPWDYFMYSDGNVFDTEDACPFYLPVRIGSAARQYTLLSAVPMLGNVQWKHNLQ